MKLNKYVAFSLIGMLFVLFFAARNPAEKKLHKPVTSDDYNYININDVLMWVSNNGDGSHDPNTDHSGFYWPGRVVNPQNTAIFEDGLIWGCIIGNDTIVNGNTHRQGLQAGKILPNGTADDPNNPRYRIYNILKDWESIQPSPVRDGYEKDINEWPVEDGATWMDIDGDGIYRPGIDQPEFTGDQVLWYVANDLNEERSLSTFESLPIGLEFQTTIFAFNRRNFLKDVVFKKYLIINKSDFQLNSMYFGYWSDDDLGDIDDDFVGCDTLLNLGYTYNSDNHDGDGSGITYGIAPPAVGHMFVQGPIVPSSSIDSARFLNQLISGYKNKPMTAFAIFFSRWSGSLCPTCPPWDETVPMYNSLRGFVWNGNPFVDPHTLLSTNFAVPGDPVSSEGWYEGPGWPGGENPGDRRQLISSGPISMAPGDSQEVTIAILIARGTDYLDSVTELKQKAHLVQIAYDINFKAAPVMEKPILKAVPDDKSVTLYWEANAEDFSKPDVYQEFLGVDDQKYRFEGYRIWQFRDREGTDPRLVATFDIKNEVKLIYEQQIINGHPATVVVIDGPNEGLRRSFSVSENSYDQQPLNNANPYYFAVTAYAYSKDSDPQFVESEPEIIEVNPGLWRIDATSDYQPGDYIIADHITGLGDGKVEILIVDPNALTGDEYRIIFEGKEEINHYFLINYSKNDTIISDCTNFDIDTVGAVINDGFILNVHNHGLDKINETKNKYAIKDVMEVNGPDGDELNPPADVFENLNSSAEWKITAYENHDGNTLDPIQEINIADEAGYHDYEIRFTDSGSDYYLTGSSIGFQPWRHDDPKAEDRVPFEIWDIGSSNSEDDNFRLTIKTVDDYFSIIEDSNRVDSNGVWSQLQNGDWEQIIAYFADSTYQEPLPESSGRLSDKSVIKVGRIILSGNLPEEGTVIRIRTWKPLSAEDIFSVIVSTPNTKDYSAAKTSLDDISVFPNPFFGTALYSGYAEQNFVRFTNLPTQITIRIFTLAGVYVRRIDKNDDNPWLDWDLKNNAGEQVASGVYIAHLEMPNIGEKVMKVAVILENKY